MSGPLDVAFAGDDFSVRDPITTLPRTLEERFMAAWRAAQAPDRYFRITEERHRLWRDALDQYHAATGETLGNPYDPGLDLGDPTRKQETRRKAVAFEKFRLAREQYAELPDPELIDFRIAQDARYRRDLAAQYSGTGNGFGAFLGDVAGEAATPHSLLAMLVPPARLAATGAQVLLRTFLGSVGREAVTQAAVGMGAQAVGEALDYATRKPLGTQQSAEEIGQNILGAGLGSALFGGGVRGLQEGWRLLQPGARAAAPSAVRDAARAVEREALDAGTNPLPPQATSAHEDLLARAQDAVARGRPAQVSDHVASATEAAIDGPSLLGSVAPRGEPGVRIEAGVAGDGGRERFVVYRDEAGAPVGVLRLTTLEPDGRRLDPAAGLTVYVLPQRRRQGIASDLYVEAARAGYNVRDIAGRGDLTPTGAAVRRALARERPGLGTAPPAGPHFVATGGRGDFAGTAPGNPDLGLAPRPGSDAELPIRAPRSHLRRLTGPQQDGAARQLGYDSAWHQLSDVAANWDAVHAGPDGRLVLVKGDATGTVATLTLRATPANRYWHVTEVGLRSADQVAALGAPLRVRGHSPGTLPGETTAVPRALPDEVGQGGGIARVPGGDGHAGPSPSDARSAATTGASSPPGSAGDVGGRPAERSDVIARRTDPAPAPSTLEPAGKADVQRVILLSRKAYGEAARHIEDAIRAGKPDVLTINRAGISANRRAALRGTRTIPGKHRDEYPPAMFKEGGAGASVRPINPSHNRAAGAYIGRACGGLPDGAKIRIEIAD